MCLILRLIEGAGNDHLIVVFYLLWTFLYCNFCSNKIRCFTQNVNLCLQQGVLFLPVFSSMKRLLRYNFGSVAIGSLIVSIIGSTQPILKSLRQRLKVADVRPENWFGKVAYYTAQYTLASIGWTIRHVNRNAYILVNSSSRY